MRGALGTLSEAEIEEARNRAKQWADQHGLAYADIAARARVTESDVKQFMAGALNPRGLRAARIAAAFATHLPIGLKFRGMSIFQAEN